MAEIESDIQWEKERECVRAREREKGGGRYFKHRNIKS